MVQMLLDDGYRVVVTDYMGLGTDGLHTYLNRVDQGRAVIDAARAVSKRGEKVAFWGYSQGGGAAAAAAELVGDYAPELNVVGTFAGAPPADPLAVLQQAAAPMLTAVAGFAAASFSDTYPEFHEALDGYLTDDGRAWMEDLKTSCVVDASRNAPKIAGDMFVDGKTFADIAEEDERIGKYLEHNKLGKVKPNAPIMVLTNPDDDLVPEPQATQLAEDYCAIGADVEYRRVVVPGSPTQPLSSGRRELTPRAPGSGHALPLLLQTGNVSDWLSDRFKGRPMKQVCPPTTPSMRWWRGSTPWRSPRSCSPCWALSAPWACGLTPARGRCPRCRRCLRCPSDHPRSLARPGTLRPRTPARCAPARCRGPRPPAPRRRPLPAAGAGAG